MISFVIDLDPQWGHVGTPTGSIKGYIKPEGSKRPQKGLPEHENIEKYDVL